ncbi:MAG: DUF2155 domain-containing protein [Acetobacteraceae bacterium]
MTRLLLLLGVAILPAMAMAQGTITATPLPPLDQSPQQPTEGTPPSGTPSSAAPPSATPPAITGQAPGFPNVWQPRTTATIQALDKVNARFKNLTLTPGKPVQFQTLTITLTACVVRPPDQPADAAAYVTVTDSRDKMFDFRGWLIRSTPASSMMQHPIYDLRVEGCGS